MSEINELVQSTELNRNFYDFIENELLAKKPLSIKGKEFRYLNKSSYKQVFTVGNSFLVAHFNKESVAVKVPSKTHEGKIVDLSLFSELNYEYENKADGEKFERFIKQNPEYLPDGERVIFIKEIDMISLTGVKRLLKSIYLD
ncbi:MAG: hypothetical protein RBS36_11505 [Thiomicrospira sp.]|jgi:hypothetical protein|nr:hypothetical protein [Thiomicrospira sp.]